MGLDGFVLLDSKILNYDESVINTDSKIVNIKGCGQNTRWFAMVSGKICNSRWVGQGKMDSFYDGSYFFDCQIYVKEVKSSLNL